MPTTFAPDEVAPPETRYRPDEITAPLNTFSPDEIGPPAAPPQFVEPFSDGDIQLRQQLGRTGPDGTVYPVARDSMERAAQDWQMAGMAGSSGTPAASPFAALFQPLFRYDPKPTPDDLIRRAREFGLADAVSPAAAQDELTGSLPPKVDKALAGVARGVQHIAEGFTSPIGIAALGLGGLPVGAQRAISLAFAAQMVSDTPQIATELGTEFGKPEDQRDYEKISELITSGAGTAAFTTLAALHGLNPAKATPLPDLEGMKRVYDESEVGPPEQPGGANVPRGAAPEEKTADANPDTSRIANSVRTEPDIIPADESAQPKTVNAPNLELGTRNLEPTQAQPPVENVAPEPKSNVKEIPESAKLAEKPSKRLTRREQLKNYYRELAKENFSKIPANDLERLVTNLTEPGYKGVMQSYEMSPNQSMRKAVWAHIRHQHTPYESLFEPGMEKQDVRPEVRSKIEKIYNSWATPEITSDPTPEAATGVAHVLIYTKLDGTRATKEFPSLERLTAALAKVKAQYPAHALNEVITQKNTAAPISQSGGEQQEFSGAVPVGGRSQVETAIPKPEVKPSEKSSGDATAMGFPAAGTPVPPTPPPPVAPGATMVQGGRLPVTLDRTVPGSVSLPQIMSALERVQRVAGSLAGNIRTGRFYQKAMGIFKPHEEIIRLGQADSLPTATHEVGHALQKQLYGTAKASGLRTLPAAVRRELQGMGKALYGSRQPVAGYTGEGFAEFMRYWLTTEDAATVAPATAKFFEQAVLTAHPEVAKALKDARSVIDIWRTQGSVERAQRQLMREPGTFARVAKALGSLVSYQGQVESGAPLEAVSKAAALKRGAALPPSEDPFKLYSWKRGGAGAVVERMAANNMLDIWGNATGPSLAEALGPVKGKRKEFGLYLFARRALERWGKNQNPGITPEDAQHIKTLYDSPEFQIAAKKYYAWWDGLLDYVVQADPAMADVVKQIRQGSNDYAPLARMIDPAKARRAAAQARSNPLMQMHGSGLPVKDIFDQTFVNAARLVNRAHQAMVLNAVVKVAQIPGLGHLIEEVPRAKVMERVSFDKVRAQLQDLGLDTSTVPDDEILHYFTAAEMPKGSAPIISVRQPDGVHWYHVDPRLYETLDGLQAYSLRNAFPGLPGLGVGLDLILGAPSRTFRLGTTGLRAAFSLITNPLRDLPTMLAQTNANPAKTAAEYPGALAAVIREGLGGKGTPGTRAFYNLGAHMGQPLGIDISHTKRVSNELFHGRILRVVLNPVDHVRQLFSITEAAPRVAELQAVAREIGWTPGTPMTPDQAVQLALAAKQVTVDFSAAGDVSRVINAAVPFYNPGIQGLRSFGRALRDHPLRSILMGLALFSFPALLNWWKNKDKDWYRSLPWRERYTYTNIDDGKNVWRIPRPFEWGNAFQVMPESILDSWYRRDPEAVQQALGHVFDTTNPLDYPVLLKVAKEQWQNRISYWDRPVVPQSELDLPPSQQVGPYTTRLAQWMGAAFPNVSPRRVDAAVRGYFGGAVPDILDAIGLGSMKSDREFELSDIPVLGTMVRRGGEYNAQSQPIADFWDIKSALDARVNAARLQAKDPNRPQTVTLDTREAALQPAFEAAARDLSAVMRVAATMKESAARQMLYRQATALAAEMVKTWKAPDRGKR